MTPKETRPAVKLTGERLVEKGLLTSDQLRKAIDKQKADRRPLGEILVAEGFITEKQLVEVLSEQLGIPFVDVEFYEVDKKVLALFPKSFLSDHLAVPLFKVQNTVTVAMADPLDINTVDRLRTLSKCDIEPVFGIASAITKILDKLFGPGQSLERVIEEVSGETPAAPRPSLVAAARPASPPPVSPRRAPAPDEKDLVAAAEMGSVIKLVDTILREAVTSRASDVHFEPDEEASRLRYRVDGVLYDVSAPPKKLEAAITSRLKIMAGLDIAERRLPQDGRIQLKIGDRDVDFRMSTFPTIYGENVVIRVLDKSAIMLSLEQLGFQPKTLDRFKALIARPHGILLVTGPTGSGKTTTLYGALRLVDAVQRNVLTLEDPVEYRIPRVRQSQIDVKSGVTFASGLRSIVRQDPDVIMIGEIRDRETAEVAIHAALTGHLVFSTLHTNDAPGAITRLIDMGVEPFLVASSIIGVLAQRLVRMLCPACKQPVALTPEMLASLKVKDLPSKGAGARAKGCDECKQFGYRGRTGIFELMEMSDPIREKAMVKASANDLRTLAIKEGMTTLRQAGVAKVLDGTTTIEEVLRVSEYEIGE